MLVLPINFEEIWGKKYWLAERLQELQALISKLFMDF